MMFRLPKDYFMFLNRSGALQVVINSILSLHWLCLERYVVGHPPFSQFFKSSIQLAKNQMQSQGRQPDNISNGTPLPFLNYVNRGKLLSDANVGIKNYFLDIKLCHPISDKEFQMITFSGTLVKQPPGQSINGLSSSDVLVDVSDFSNLCTNFMGSKELFVPQSVCLIHLDLCVPSLGIKQGFSALIYLPEDAHVEPLHKGRKQNLFSINIQMNQTTRITLLFKDLEAETHGSSVVNESFCNPTQTRDEELNKPQRHRGFSLLEFCLTVDHSSYSRSSRGFLQDPYIPNHLNPPYPSLLQDKTKVESAQHSYYEGSSHRMPGHDNGNYTSVYKNRDYIGSPSPFSYNWNISEGIVPSYRTNGTVEHEPYGYPTHGKGSSSSGLKIQNGFQRKINQNWKPKAEVERQTPYYTLQAQGSSSSKPARNPSSQSSSHNEEPDLEIIQGEISIPTKESLLGDPKIFKNYANSKSKSTLILNMLPELKPEDMNLLLGTLEPIIKEVCNNKYGNYLVQKLARSLPPEKLERFISLVVDFDSVGTSFLGYSLSSERNFCSSGNR